MRNLTPVILQTGLKEALSEGGIVEVHCVEDATKVFNVWQGTWRVTLRVGDQTALLVISRGLEPREFKTVTGLISFAVEMGLTTVHVPLRKGEKATWTYGTEMDTTP
ncbi:MAG: hypothetical protein DI533_17095 [Cereibacter sphaeroides]|uniref:Uncharacterized protein n=1 Tax=Cereibacter sphaeroides TaxID=1063 RepID=A0A2W5TZA9_CERSP|nr:MAG: hypothetical protein DI533_17095 [Cereibacter sphaeroides]